MCVETLPQVFFYYPDRKRGPRRDDKRSPVGQIAAFSPAESVPTTREIEIEARVEANFSSLHRKETINISASCLYIKNSTS